MRNTIVIMVYEPSAIWSKTVGWTILKNILYFLLVL